MTCRGILADAYHSITLSRKLAVIITDRTSLSRTTGSVILGIEVDNQWLA